MSTFALRTVARGLLAGAWLVFSCNLVAGAGAAPQWPGRQLDGSVLLPNQWSIQPVGRQVAVGDFPVNLALHPSGRYVAVLHCGYSQHEVRVLDTETETEVSRASLDEAFYGLAWSPDGAQLFVSGAGAEVIHVFAFDGGRLTPSRDLALRDPKEQGVPAGRVLHEKSTFYVPR